MDEKEKEWLKKNKGWLKKQGKVYDEKTGKVLIDESGFFKTTNKNGSKKSGSKKK